MPTAPSKLAVVVRGGWNGHSPVEATDMFIPHLEPCTIEDAGHMLHHDQPERLAQVIAAFLGNEQ